MYILKELRKLLWFVENIHKLEQSGCLSKEFHITYSELFIKKTGTKNFLDKSKSLGKEIKKHNKKFKADKNFVTKVALRGFAPPHLLRQFCPLGKTVFAV